MQTIKLINKSRSNNKHLLNSVVINSDNQLVMSDSIVDNQNSLKIKGQGRYSTTLGSPKNTGTTTRFDTAEDGIVLTSGVTTVMKG